MDLDLLQKKDEFPIYVQKCLEQTPVDYPEKHEFILQSGMQNAKHLEAGVVLLLYFRNSEYVFQLIKRSENVAQAGDISCPGGILEKNVDELLNHILLQTGIIRTADDHPLDRFSNADDQSASLIRLFLMNGLREAWEEIGLSPLNVSFLGALPTYSLTYFARTIFPLVCLVRHDYDYHISAEVEKVLEIPVRLFFKPSSYAMMEIESSPEIADPRLNVRFPCLVIPGPDGKDDILWGATFQIITRFLKMIGGNLPECPTSRTVKRTLSPYYTSGNR